VAAAEDRVSATEVAVGPEIGAEQPDTPGWRALRATPRARLLALLAPAAVYLAVRELGLVLLDWMAARNRTDTTSALTSWDGQWFLGIAQGGYDHVPATLADAFGRRSAETPLAFFPGYPTLVRWVAALPGVHLLGAAFAVSVVSGVVGAYGLQRLGRRVAGGSTRTGLILVALFAASPMGIVLSMTYSEATFCALAAWALVGVLERRWLLAGLCCAAAGLVRPTAAALVLAVGLAALVAVLSRRDGWRPWLAGLLAPAGLVGYLVWVAVRTGQSDGWFGVQQRGWDSRFDGGAATVRFGLDVLASARSVLELATVWLVVGAVALVVVGWRRRLEWPLLVYGLGVLLMDLGSNGLMNSKARLLLPAFTLLVPVALALTRRRTSTMLAVLVAVAVFSAWFGAYSITAWPYAI
jgi:hypothetical protein